MHFLFNIEIIYPPEYNIELLFASLNINYLRWIISDIKQKGMEYLLVTIALIFIFTITTIKIKIIIIISIITIINMIILVIITWILYKKSSKINRSSHLFVYPELKLKLVFQSKNKSINICFLFKLNNWCLMCLLFSDN